MSAATSPTEWPDATRKRQYLRDFPKVVFDVRLHEPHVLAAVPVGPATGSFALGRAFSSGSPARSRCSWPMPDSYAEWLHGAVSLARHLTIITADGGGRPSDQQPT